MGEIYFAQTIPYAVVSPLAGSLVDKFGATYVIVSAHALRIVAASALLVTAGAGGVSSWLLIGFALVLGVGNAAFDVAYQAAVPMLVTNDQITSANARLQTTGSLAAILVQSLGGIMLEHTRAANAFGGIVALAIVAIILLFPIFAHIGKSDGSLGSISFRAPVRFIRDHSSLGRILIVTAIANLGIALAAPALILFYYRTLGLQLEAVGFIGAAALTGGLVGGLLSSRLLNYGTRLTLLSTCIAIGVGLLGLASIATTTRTSMIAFVGSSIFAALRGMATTAFNVAQFSYRQSVVPADLQGRISGLSRTVTWSTIPIGSAADIVLLPNIGVHGTIIVAGFILLIAGIVASRNANTMLPTSHFQL